MNEPTFNLLSNKVSIHSDKQELKFFLFFFFFSVMDNNRLPSKHADIAKGFLRDQKSAIKQGNISADC